MWREHDVLIGREVRWDRDAEDGGLEQDDVVEAVMSTFGATNRVDGPRVERGEIRDRVFAAAVVRLVQKVVPGNRGVVAELVGQRAPCVDEVAHDSVAVRVEAVPCRDDRGAVFAASPAAGVSAVGDRRPLGCSVPADCGLPAFAADDIRR